MGVSVIVKTIRNFKAETNPTHKEIYFHGHRERLPSDGHWRLVVFAGRVTNPAQRSRVEAFAGYLESPTSFIKRYTPKDEELFDVITVQTLRQRLCELRCRRGSRRCCLCQAWSICVLDWKVRGHEWSWEVLCQLFRSAVASINDILFFLWLKLLVTTFDVGVFQRQGIVGRSILFGFYFGFTVKRRCKYPQSIRHVQSNG